MNITNNKPGRLVLSILLAGSLLPLAASMSIAKTRLQAGVLECRGEGGWGAIIVSRKEFNCVFTSASGKPLGRYKAVIRKFGIDIGKTGKTALQWAVLGPATKVGDHYVIGSLQGQYAGVGAEAAVGVGVGANALLGGGPDSFVLQPISVQAQTGINVAAAVQSLVLSYVGLAN